MILRWYDNVQEALRDGGRSEERKLNKNGCPILSSQEETMVWFGIVLIACAFPRISKFLTLVFYDTGGIHQIYK